jgi:predicted MFS family arabinose efflux permease
VGESLGSTGSTLWGITSAGQEYTAKVISFNGIATYGAMALGAPLGVVLDQQWGLASLGLLTILIGAVSLALAIRKSPVPTVPGEHLPFTSVLGRVAPHGLALALGGMGYSVLATFITLFYAHLHWNGAALCLTAFGVAFVLARVIFIQAINRFGGFQVAIACLTVECVGLLMLWRAGSPWTAFAAAALTGFGFSLVFPALGVEAIEDVPEHNRGPLAGMVIGFFGYVSVFLFALLCVVSALGITIVLRQMKQQ